MRPEAIIAFCAEHGITHVGHWARARLGQDKLSELKEMAEYWGDSRFLIMFFLVFEGRVIAARLQRDQEAARSMATRA